MRCYLPQEAFAMGTRGEGREERRGGSSAPSNCCRSCGSQTCTCSSTGTRSMRGTAKTVPSFSNGPF